MQKKNSPELDYMLVEFRKLERQLLGAPGLQQNEAGGGPKKNEAAGSKERREKLHGFILHLEDTIRQITEGCVLETAEAEAERMKQQLKDEEDTKNTSQQNSTSTVLPTDNFTAEQASLSQLTPQKEKEESVQRLEEHIIANLLPVKVRLTRQLAAQKGASRNPATAPIVQPSSGGSGTGGGINGNHPNVATSSGGSTFAAAAEAKRKAKERNMLLAQEKQRQLELLKNNTKGGTGTTKGLPSQYGKPIGPLGGGSSLTSRLHGRTLGEPTNTVGTNAGGGGTPITITGTVADPIKQHQSSTTAGTTTISTPKRQILYAGIAPGSTQVPSSINAVSGVHPGLIDENAARAVTMAEDERKRMERLEVNAARIAGLKLLPSSSAAAAGVKPGPATLAARASLVPSSSGAATSTTSGGKIIPRRNQPLPTSSGSSSVRSSSSGSSSATSATTNAAAQQLHQLKHPPPTAASKPPSKPKKRHVPLNFNDPKLTSQEQFDLRLKEARWRQSKRRRVRKRQKIIQSSSDSEGMWVTTTGDQQQLELNQNGASQIVYQSSPQHQVVAQQATPRQSPVPVSMEPGPIPPSPTCCTSENQNNEPPPYDGSTSRTVEYICAICNEPYQSSTDLNPWWAMIQQHCPKCGKEQIPRLDITAPANVMEYHPALLAHLDDIGNNGGKIGMLGMTTSIAETPIYHHPQQQLQQQVSTTTTTTYQPVQYHEQQDTTTSAPPSAASTTPQGGVTTFVNNNKNKAMTTTMVRSYSDSDVSQTDESDGEGGSANILKGLINYDESSDEEEDRMTLVELAADENGDIDSVTREEVVEREEFGHEYKGDTLSDDQARRLLVLMEHASTCPGR